MQSSLMMVKEGELIAFPPRLPDELSSVICQSLWEPVQIITWLWVILNTTDGTVKASSVRIVKMNADLGFSN